MAECPGAPPSSPPLGAITDPFTTTIPAKLSSPRSPKLPPRRKRPRVSDGTADQGYASASSAHNGDVSSNSSDAPFFSSDDLADADASNYVSPARKKQYRRTWYEPERSESAVSHRLMRTVTRTPKDSGIYMGSESSSSSFSEGFELETAALKVKAVQKQSKTMQAFLASNDLEQSISDAPVSSRVKVSQTPPKTREETVVEQAVNHSLDHGVESIDLSGMNLHDLPAECFAPLRNFVKQPVFHRHAYTDAACTPLTPDLKIFLSNNQLSSIPASLFDLSYLTVLSLRGNNLTELPSAIARLRNLQELNLDGNPLRWLPYELMHFCHGFVSRLDYLSLPTSMLALGLPPTQDLIPAITSKSVPLFIVGRTPPALYELDGSLSRLSPVPSPRHYFNNTTSHRTAYERLGHDPRRLDQHVPAESNAVSSLFEIALRTCARSSLLPELASMLPTEAPPTVFAALDRARHVVTTEGPGGGKCSVCGKQFIIARAEWIEVGRNCSSTSSVCMTKEPIPFLRQACSWGCVKSLEEQE